MRKKMITIIVEILIFIVIVLGTIYIIDLNRMKNNEPVFFSTWGRKYINPEDRRETNMEIVLSLEDKISDNTAWCGTFNLIWNDLKNDLAKQDIVFNPQLEIVKNLNNGTFNTDNLSERSYYKTYGVPSLKLKEQIEKAIKEKFNETSDILDDFNWEGRDPKDYFLYAMLKKEFEFPKVFTELDKGTFGNYENVEYFGINDSTEDEVREQVKVLYYNSKEDFAIKLITKTEDEVILSKGCNKDTFEEIYKEINEKTKLDNPAFLKTDILKIPNISFDLKKEIKEIQDKPFLFSNGDKYAIEKALQTIQFDLDKKGGKIKSEAAIMMKNQSIMMPKETREFIFDDTFVIMLKEKDKELPYFAAKISDISKVQKDVTKINNEQNEEKTSYFTGTVIDSFGIFEEVAWAKEVPGKIQITTQPDENQAIRKSSDKIVVYLKEDDGNSYDPGTKVKVEYTGDVMKSYPAEVNCVSITEIQNNMLNLYKELLEKLINEDPALNSDAKFIAIDFENFSAYRKGRNGENYNRSLSINEKQALLDLCKKYNDNVIEANFEQLKQQGHFNEETMSLDGILISVEKMEKITQDKAIITMGKYRSGLGAIWPKYEANLVDNKWKIEVQSMLIS